MFAQLLLLFASTKFVLAEGDHNNYGCHQLKEEDCPKVDGIVITIDQNGNGKWKYYCNCRERRYQISFEYDENVEGKPGFSIPSQFFVNSQIATLKIPEACNYIESGAFYGSTIGSMTFEGKANPSIESDAFGEVTFTGALTLSNQQTKIKNSAFYYTRFEDNLVLSDALLTVQSYAFQYATFGKELILKTAVTNVFDHAFYYSTFEKGLKFENKGTSITSSAFMHANFKGTLTLPDDLSSIEESTFESAEFNVALVIPKNTESIKARAFKEAKFHNTITFKNEEIVFKYITSENEFIGAFQSAVFYKTLELPNKLETIPPYIFYGAEFKHSITFPGTLTDINNNAFEGAIFTDAIILPTSLKNIRSSAFKMCTFNLENTLIFGKNMEKIESSAFQNSNLQSIQFDPNAKLEEIGNEAFQSLFQLKTGENKALYAKTIGENAFEGDEVIDFTSITSKNINQYAFRSCFNLVVADGIKILPDGKIGNYAFQNCQKLSGGLTIDDATDEDNLISTIGDYAFIDTGLTKLNLPPIKSIAGHAFENCVLLEGPSEPKYSELKIESISEYAFSGNVLLHFTKIISTSIGTHAFEFCRNLGSDIFIYNKPKQNPAANVGSYSFYSCDKLGSLTYDLSHLAAYKKIEEKDKIQIPQYAFAKSGLSGKLIIPHTVTKIDDYAFLNCYNISEVEINRKNTVTLEIGKYAFCNSNIGNELLIPRFVTVIDECAFAKTSIRSLTVEGTSFKEPITTRQSNPPYKSLKTDIKTGAFSDCKNLETVVFGNETIEIVSDTFKGCHFKSMTLGNINTIPNDAFIGMTEMEGTFDIPDSIKTIGERAFSECSNIKKIEISSNSNLETIGIAAFYKCKNLESIVIPPKVTTINNYAFYQCINLKTVTILIHSQESKDITINDYAFYGCVKLEGPLTLPEGLSSIGEGAFQGCELLTGSLTFPDSLTEIKERAFMGCRTLSGGLNFGANFDTIGAYAFCRCSNLNGNLNFVDYIYTDNTQPTPVVKGKTLNIHEGAFQDCSGLTGDINIPLRCKLYNGNTLSSNVFKGCSSFRGNLNLPDDCISIPKGTFCNCINLKGEIKSNLIYIGDEAFRNCGNLIGSIDLTSYNYNKFIGAYAFSNCTGLNGQLIFKDFASGVLIKIGDYAFYNCAGLTGSLNTSSFNIVGKYAFAGCSGFNGPLYFGQDLHKIGEHAFADCSGFSNTLSFRSPMNTELSIEESAFKGCTGFKDGTLLITMERTDVSSDKVETYYLKIERNAFEDTKFKDIRYIGREQPDCDCDIGLPSRKGIHTSSNYDGKSFCGNPLHKSKLSGGAIAGIVIACIVVVAIIVGVVVFFILKNKKNKDRSENEVEMNQDP